MIASLADSLRVRHAFLTGAGTRDESLRESAGEARLVRHLVDPFLKTLQVSYMT